jgi:8-oxo-dGTP pyrophosphatase MutT (NUDIX family)
VSAEPKPSATVVVIRDENCGLELLLLERSAQSGPWVFPGGKVEPADRIGQPESAQDSARRTAVRETREETGLELSGPGLIPISRWITPEVAPKRFDTWFFLSRLERNQEVRVDGAEIRSHRWMQPRSALDAHRHGEIRLAPPTFVTVSWLTEHTEAEAALESLGRQPVLTFRPRIHPTPDGICMLYPGDAGYPDGEVEHAGPRHRLWLLPDGWRYERSPSDGPAEDRQERERGRW